MGALYRMRHLQAFTFKDSSTSKGSAMDSCSLLLQCMDLHCRQNPGAQLQSLQAFSIILGEHVTSSAIFTEGEDWYTGTAAVAALAATTAVAALADDGAVPPIVMGRGFPTALPLSHAHMPALQTLMVECTGSPIASLKLMDLMTSLLSHRPPGEGPKMRLIDLVAAFMPAQLSDKKNAMYRALAEISEVIRARFVCSYLPGMPLPVA